MTEQPEPGPVLKGRRPKAGRFPEWLEPNIPYRIEEWSKSAAYVVPKGWRPLPDSGRLPTVRRPERPGAGTIAVYVGGSDAAPRPEFLPKEYRVMKEGYAYSERQAHARARAWVRAHLLESGTKSRRRSKAG